MWGSLISGLFGGATNAGLSFAESALQNYYSQQASVQQYLRTKELMEHANQLSMDNVYSTPLAYRQGLEHAGYNPMLVVQSGTPNAPTASSGSVSAPEMTAPKLGNVVSSAMQAAKLKSDVESSVADARMLKADASSAQAEADARASEARLEKRKADLELEALDYDPNSVDLHIDSKGRPWDRSPTEKDYMQMLRNGWERRRYKDSMEHAVGEDVLQGLEGATSAFSRFQRKSLPLRSLKKSLRKVRR